MFLCLFFKDSNVLCFSLHHKMHPIMGTSVVQTKQTNKNTKYSLISRDSENFVTDNKQKTKLQRAIGALSEDFAISSVYTCCI